MASALPNVRFNPESGPHRVPKHLLALAAKKENSASDPAAHR
jgi:hypothetical protein